MGRAALDEQAISLIEKHHPDIRFDWNQILKGDDEAPRRLEQQPGRDREAGRPPREPRQHPHQPRPVTEAPAVEPAPAEPLSPAHAELGSEGLARLRARYAEVMASISGRVTDPERREQLKAAAERLNPDSWVTSDEVRLGLEQYEAILESLRDVLGRRRRRRRGHSGAASASAGSDRTSHGHD
ncbi:MAG: hypothetical protein ACRD1U_11165, partial [Vicinamibacterales bacterium]